MQTDAQRPTDPAESAADIGIAMGLDLFPISVVAFGSPSQPAGRLMALQSAVARVVRGLFAIRRATLRRPRPSWLRLRVQ